MKISRHVSIIFPILAFLVSACEGVQSPTHHQGSMDTNLLISDESKQIRSLLHIISLPEFTSTHSANDTQNISGALNHAIESHNSPLRNKRNLQWSWQDNSSQPVIIPESNSSSDLLITDPQSLRNYSYVFHVIPHTHDDPGWLTTIDGYYTGESSPFGECVKDELNKIFNLLESNLNRVFSYAEMVFFEKWYYDEINFDDVGTNATYVHKKIKEMLSNKQLYFPNAGWVMNDEACTYYEDIIEQFIIGHRFVHQEFGYIPTVGWSIDPFGHSSTHAYLLAQMGINMAYIGRIHYKDLAKRKDEDRLAFVWIPDKNFPEWSLIGHINYNKYGDTTESGTCFPKVCQQEIENDLNKTVSWLMHQAASYSSHHVYFQIGEDFVYSRRGSRLYRAIQEFAHDLNSFPYNNYSKTILSSMDTYANAWFDDYSRAANQTLSVKEDDFFPYADRTLEPGYWTGFFSTRPTLKEKIRSAGKFLQTSKKILYGMLLGIENATERNISFYQMNTAVSRLEKDVALCQHHDGVTGTSMSHVNQDMLERLANATKAVWELIQQGFDRENERVFNLSREIHSDDQRNKSGNETSNNGTSKNETFQNATNNTNSSNESNNSNATAHNESYDSNITAHNESNVVVNHTMRFMEDKVIISLANESLADINSSSASSYANSFYLDDTSSSVKFFEYSTHLSPPLINDTRHKILLLRIYNPGHGRATVHRVKIPHSNLKGMTFSIEL